MKFYKIFLLLLVPYILSAKVTLTAPDSFFKGDKIVFKITANGADVKFPNISDIDGIAVQNAGTSSAITIVNGVRKQKLVKSFVIRPAKDITIPSFNISINGKIEQTKPKTIKMKLVEKTLSSIYDLEIAVNKKEGYVGEDILFTLIFKYRKDTQLVDLNFYKPNFENFWTKELQSKEQIIQGDYVVHQLNYLLFPQKDGKLSIEPLRIDAIVSENTTQNYGFFSTNSTKSIPIYSNRLDLDIKPLPKDIKLIGEFEISSTIDKTNITQGEAISYKLNIKGRGNLDDLDEIKLSIPNTTIYDNPSKKEFNIKDELYGGIYNKTYSIVAQNDFEIPAISLKYFDKKTQTIKTIKTKSYTIKVKGAVKKAAILEVAKTQKTLAASQAVQNKIVEDIVKTTDNQKIIFFILGMIFASILISLYFIFKNKRVKKEETPLSKQIKKVNSLDKLLKLLVVYINIDEQLDKIIYDLENKKSKTELKKVKKEVLNIIKDRTLEIKF
ncbi:MAG: BatD family protein [Campylobacterota bacterium]|nr:BatD family protein [Campylobacterota bacterium]